MNQNFVFRGKAHWTRVFEGNLNEWEGEQYGSVTLEMDKESWSKFKSSGLKLQPRPVNKNEEDSPDAITFRRNILPKIYNGKAIPGTGGLVRVKDKDGNLWEPDVLIGNGSEVEILVTKYVPKTNKKIPGHRLEAIKVLEHIPYEPFNEEEEEVVEEPVKTEAPKQKKKIHDDIPF